jgi:ABC-type nitrate/sulfonate/bicarbonate transport system substrate-binding protein
MRGPWSLAALLAPVVLPLLAVGPSPGAKQTRRLRLNIFTPDSPTIAARARGFFAAEGLDVEITVTPNSMVQMRGLGDGTWDVAFTAFDNVLAWSGREGAEIVAVAQTIASIYLPVYARAEIRDWDDLRGQPLAADAVDTAFALVLRRVLLEHGLDLERGDYTLVEVGNGRLRLESMRRGETFAAVLSPPATDGDAEAAGLRRLGDHREVLPDYPGTVVAVNRAWAAANRDAVVGFLRAWLAGARWVADNREAAIDLVAADQGLGREAAARLLTAAGDGALNLPGLASVLDLRTRFGFTLPLGNDVTRFYDLGYYVAARGR